MNFLKKLLAASVVVFIFNSVVGMLTCGWLFNWVYNIPPTYVWKDMQAAPSPCFFLGSFVISLLFVGVYMMFVRTVSGYNTIMKGIIYGLAVFAVGTLPGMFVTHVFMTVAPTVVVYWLISALILLPVKGVIAAYLTD